jgi:cytochrome oxidase Cu insertion factor (SCO1/SenC/PrrC family)
VEDRVSRQHGQRPGAALFALAAIVLITAAWWALALWPVGAAEPEWLARTRAACFGSHGGGLPDAGGWILLIGEPLGMAAALSAVWGGSLRSNMRWIWARQTWRLTTALFVVAAIAFFSTLGLRAARAQGTFPVEFAPNSGLAQRVEMRAPSFALVDQKGEPTSLSEFRGEQTLLTFAYGHCSTVCPSIVSDLKIARSDSRAGGVRIAILTLDPWRDTPERLPTLAQHWKIDAGDRVLSGSVADVDKTLDALAVGRKRNETTGDIDHGSTVMLIDNRGRIRWRVDGGGRADFAALLRDSR